MGRAIASLLGGGWGIIAAHIRRLLRVRIVRYALVGGIGIPVNLLAYAVFLRLMGTRLDLLASACAFEVSTNVNFVLNQLYTYSDQKHLHGWDWPKRALKAQASSASALVLAFAIAQGLKYGLHVNPFVAQACGIAGSFFYNFTISNRFVFRPAPAAAAREGSAK